MFKRCFESNRQFILKFKEITGEMKCLEGSFVLVSVVLLSFAGKTSQDGHKWTYNNQEDWPPMCREGERQSPINIDTKSTVVDKWGVHIKAPLRLHGYKDVDLFGVNNGHTVKFYMPDAIGQQPILSGGPLLSNYTLLQMHFHWLSEHAIDDYKYPMEIHFVHVREGLSLRQAVHEPDGLAVLGIMCQVVSNRQIDGALVDLVDHLQYLRNQTGEGGRIPIGKIDLTPLLSVHSPTFYTYAGSLTTPTCDESVTWIIMQDPIYITDEQYRAFSRVNVGGTNNFRSLQPVNSRTIFQYPASSGAIIISPCFTGIIAAIAAYLSTTILTVACWVAKVLNETLDWKKQLLGFKLSGF